MSIKKERQLSRPPPLYTLRLSSTCNHRASLPQRMPHDWKAQILDDEVAADAIMKRATKHYTVMINLKEEK